MGVTVEKLENLERKVTLALPWDEINKKVEAGLKRAQKRAKVDGFRPGKAPLRMIESMYGAGVRDDVLNESAQKAFYETVVAEQLKVAGLQRLDAVENQDDDKVFKIDAVFEVYPDISIGNLAEQEVTKIVTEVGDAEIDKTVDILRRQRTRFNRTERPAREGDRVIIDFAGTVDGVPFDGGSAENYPFLLGQGQMMPEFEAGVSGMKEGDVKEVTVNFPDDYHGKDVAGKTAVFSITLKNTAEPVLPEVDADFARSLGIEDGSVEKMRDEVKKNVSREINRRTGEMTKESAMNALLASTQIEVPSVLVARESEHLAGQMRENLLSQGMSESNLSLKPEMFAETAKRRVALSLIMAQLIEDEKLQPTREQIEAVVADFAESYEDPQEVIDWYFKSEENLQGPTTLAVEQNVVDYILKTAKTADKALSFDEVMGQQPQA